jgi:phosphoribosylcarboxyaminoimidazole (NCAIR) mutase
MGDGEIIALAAVGLGGLWLFTRRPASAGPAVTGATPPSPWQQVVGGIESAVQKYTGVPVAAVGNAAAGAPTWLKVAVLPVGATAVAQKVITHPVDTAKTVYNDTVGAGKKAISAVGSIFGF